MTGLCLAAFLCIALTDAVSASPLPVQTKPRPDPGLQDRVILIHGLGRTPLSMIWLEWTLKRAGYQVVNLRYPSRRWDALQVASERLDKAINPANQAVPRHIHFVTHSMGGIVVRNYLTNHTLPNLGSVVMLAPPNHGSELADHLRKNCLGRWFLGPVGCQLGTGPSDLPARLGPAHFPLGVIAADGPGLPWNSFFCQGPSDGIVSVQSTRLDGMADFLIVDASHTLIMWHRDVSREILAFLKNGRFSARKI